MQDPGCKKMGQLMRKCTYCCEKDKAANQGDIQLYVSFLSQKNSRCLLFPFQLFYFRFSVSVFRFGITCIVMRKL